MELVLVGIGGFAGAVARRVVDLAVTDRAGGVFPFGTLLINVSGSFLLGLLFAWAIERDVLPVGIRGPLMIGFLGAYTTFSTWMLESWRLVEDGAWALAAVNLAGSVVLGLVAVVAGLALGRALPQAPDHDERGVAAHGRFRRERPRRGRRLGGVDRCRRRGRRAGPRRVARADRPRPALGLGDEAADRRDGAGRGRSRPRRARRAGRPARIDGPAPARARVGTRPGSARGDLTSGTHPDLLERRVRPPRRARRGAGAPAVRGARGGVGHDAPPHDVDAPRGPRLRGRRGIDDRPRGLRP